MLLDSIKAIKNVRLYVLGLSCFIACLLYQTNVGNRGTIFALISIAVIIGGAVFRNNNLARYLTRFQLYVYFFFFFSILSTILNSTHIHYLPRYIAFFVAFIFFSHCRLSNFENEFLKDAYCISMSVYAGLAAYSYIVHPVTTNYIHASVSLFGTKMDPNYLCIPFVAAISLCVSRLFRGEKTLGSVLVLLINAFAILLAASRGAMVAVVATIVLQILLNVKSVNFSRYILIGVGALLLLVLLYPFLNTNFHDQIVRLTEFGVEDDNGRFDLWTAAWQHFLDSPIFGIGLGGMFLSVGHASHNTVVQVICETGIFGFICFCLVVVRGLKYSYKIDKDLFFMFAVFLVQCLFVDAVADRMMWLLLMWVSALSWRTSIPSEISK